jgi:uncharacterized coiled-coil protein SlyX
VRNAKRAASRSVAVASTTSPHSLHFIGRYTAAMRNMGAALLCLVLCLPGLEAAAADDMAELKRAIEQLQAQNRELAKRITALEAEKAERKQATRSAPAPTMPPPELAPKGAQVEPLQTRESAAGGSAKAKDTGNLEGRVKELEVTKTAQEDSVRSIIQSALSKVGSKINEFVSLGGSLEVTAGRETDFTGRSKDSVTLSNAELDLEIRASDWVTGYMTTTFDSGTSILFPTTPTFNTGVDRLTLDKAYVTIGDTQRFPIFAKAGLDYLDFGTSTGVHRTDVLSVVNPLTTEAFELRKPGVGIGFGLPTPAPTPPTPPVIVPPVRPLVINPLISSLAMDLGYRPPPVKPKPLTPVTFPPEPPPFYGIVTLYDASATDVPERRITSSINARLGYRAHGNCGRPYSELTSSLVCPWSLDLNFDYDSSVFDSRFLQSEYLPFLSQIGTIPGVAASVKVNVGPFLVVGEWDSAIDTARFVDGSGRAVQIMPSAWQVALGYQFDWNPWVETIGAQGDYVAFGFSGTSDLAGVTEMVGTTLTRVGTLPQYRMSITAGEWVLESTKLTIEYSHNWDYPIDQGGTGRQADGIFLDLTYNW